MKPLLPTAVLGIGAATFGLSVAFAQPTASAAPAQASFAMPPYNNLKVLPPDITRANLLNTMKSFSQSLGVRCTYCHVGEEGQPLPSFDFASDAKDKKLVARKMLVMVHRINAQDFGVKDFSQVKVTCFTCHRGSVTPLTMPPDAAVPVPPPTPEKSERG